MFLALGIRHANAPAPYYIVLSGCTTVPPFTESDDTRGCNNTICPPEDEQVIARNMLRTIM